MCIHLWICVQITNTLNICHKSLSMWCIKAMSWKHLRGLPTCVQINKTRVCIVLCISREVDRKWVFQIIWCFVWLSHIEWLHCSCSDNATIDRCINDQRKTIAIKHTFKNPLPYESLPAMKRSTANMGLPGLSINSIAYARMKSIFLGGSDLLNSPAHELPRIVAWYLWEQHQILLYLYLVAHSHLDNILQRSSRLCSIHSCGICGSLRAVVVSLEKRYQVWWFLRDENTLS